ncbi:MAG: hypothetical protein ACHQVS_01840, partial [Candidatus Babeliales bacterium]
MKRLIFSLLLLLAIQVNAHEWLYPVAQLANGKVLLIYQTASADIELFSWDPVTGNADKTLASRYTPLGVTVIPGTNSFSFIDSGRIRIKYEGKRSARALDIPMPLYGIGPVSWTKGGIGFFSAQDQENHAIYACALHTKLAQQNPVSCMLQAPGIDYMYPSCTESALFYVTRQVDDRVKAHAPRCQKHANCRCRPLDPVDAFVYSINMIQLNEISVVCHENMKKSEERVLVREHTVIAAQEHPLVFLKMISDSEGFVLEHAQVLEKEADIIIMRCNRLHKDESNTWSLTYLFSYTIPAALVLPRSTDRMCEGFLPFVPWYESGSIYFVDCRGGDGSEIYRYDIAIRNAELLIKNNEARRSLITLQSNSIERRRGTLYCAPMIIGKNLIYGGKLPE